MRFLLRLLGVHVFVGPDAARVTVPRWMGRFGRDVLERTRQDIEAKRSDQAWQFTVVGRSLHGRVREDVFR